MELNNVNKVKQGNVLRIKSGSGTTSISCGAYNKDSVKEGVFVNLQQRLDPLQIVRMDKDFSFLAFIVNAFQGQSINGKYIIANSCHR